MTRYPYAAGLKGPAIGTGRMRLTHPLLRLFFRMNDTHARRFRPILGTSIRKILVPGFQDAEIDCFVVEGRAVAPDAPAIVYLHGGGFFGGFSKMHFQNACFFADALHCRVFLPAYRTSYRNKFPIPVEDCYAATKWIAGHASALGFDPTRLVVYGDSAGGCLAAATALMARDRKEFPIAFQMLVYPVTDRLQTGRSLREYPDGTWSTEANRQMWDLYLGGADPGGDGYASPLQAKTLAGLPPAYVEPAEIDCLRDEGVAYARRLDNAGVPTILNVVKGAYHAFEQEYPAPFVVDVLNHRCDVLRERFQVKSE
ncbi:MAG: alpha/beta hydrolase [Candidatus Izemoplasmatales bacterium]